MAFKKVGGEVDSLCGKCKMTLAHTILAMVGDKVARVQCNTCGAQHAYRGPQASSSTVKVPRVSAAKSAAGRSSAASAVQKVSVSFEQLLSQKDASLARRYSPKDTYAQEDLIEHPTFGYGIVTAARPDKVTVLFKMDEKTLVHGRGGQAPSRPTFERPRATATGPADKPLSSEDAGEPSVPAGGEEPLS